MNKEKTGTYQNKVRIGQSGVYASVLKVQPYAGEREKIYRDMEICNMRQSEKIAYFHMSEGNSAPWDPREAVLRSRRVKVIITSFT